MLRSGQRTRGIWAAAILTALGSAPQRPGQHLMPAYRVVAELCTAQHSVASPSLAALRDPVAESEAGPSPVTNAVSAGAEEQYPSPQSAAGSAGASGERLDTQADGMRLVARLLMWRLSDGSLSGAQPTAHQQVHIRCETCSYRGTVWFAETQRSATAYTPCPT